MEVKQTEKFVPSGPSTSWARDSINMFGGPILQRSMIRQDLDSIGAKPTIGTFLKHRLWRRFLAHAATIASVVELASATKMQEGNDHLWLHQPVQGQLRSRT